MLFSTVANCIVDAQSISNYEPFEEFGILNYIPSGYMAEPTRLELATSAVTVLRSNQLNYGSTKITKELQTNNRMEPNAGFEPATDRLQGGCSTTELIRHRRSQKESSNCYLVAAVADIKELIFLDADFLLIIFFLAALSIFFCASIINSFTLSVHALSHLVRSLVAFFIPVFI